MSLTISEATATAQAPLAPEAEPQTRADFLVLANAPALPALGWRRYTKLGLTAKRTIDLIISSILLIVLSPVLLAIALAIRITNPGPALFRQTRVGFGEQPFEILKFRTMRVDNDDSAHRDFVTSMLRGEDNSDGNVTTFKIANDPRVTPIGRWLRRTSLDELPQLVNVFRGEMSLVGPRPSLYYELDEYAPRHRLRATSVPGMTGLWQVEGRSLIHMRDALDLDVAYVETCSVKQDLSILARTAKVVAQGL